MLAQMEKSGYLSSSEFNNLKSDSLVLNFHRTDHKDGTAAYFREFLRRYMTAKKPAIGEYPEWNKKQYVLDSLAWETDPLYGWCNKHRKKNGQPYNIYTDGLKVYTTIDSRMQKYAEEAAIKQMK